MQLRWGVLVSALLSLLPLASAAQTGGGAREKAADRFEQREAHYNIQEYEEALAGYKEAYLLSKEPALLFNIGQCYRHLDRVEEALKSYRAFLREVPDTAVRPGVEKIIAELEARL